MPLLKDPKDQTEQGVTCPCCGGMTKASLTKNRTIYVWCRNVIDEETGEYCGYNAKLGRTASKAFIKHHNEKYGDLDDVRLSEQEGKPADVAEPEERTGGAGIGHNGGPPLDDEPDERASEREGGSAGGSLGAAVKHFLTG